MIGLIVQARSASTRFPGKMLAEVGGKPMLEHVLQRCAAAKGPEIRVLALPKNDKHERLARKIASRNGFETYAPDCEPGNVLERFYRTAIEYRMDIIVRVTGDCPLIDPAIIDLAVQNYVIARNSCEYMTNTMLRVHPRGMDVEVFSFNALHEAFEKVLEYDPKLVAYDQEHVTPYLRRNPKRFLHGDLSVPHVRNESHRKLRLTVDYPEDLDLIEAVYQACKGQVHWEHRPSDTPQDETERLPKGAYPMFGLLNILHEYEKNPTWVNINGKYKQAG